MTRYRYKVKKERVRYEVYFLFFLIGIFIGLSSDILFFSKVETNTQPSVIQTQPPIISTQRVEINLVAVDEEGNGVITPLSVEVEPGDGKVLTNIEKLLFWVDTQYSIQVAKQVAENITKINTNNVDITYSLVTNATLIGGPSAGASLTVATIAALENKQIKDDVMLTGGVNPDGTIGQVGGVLEKAKAAKEVGIKVFLVPEGQGTETLLKPNETCVRRYNFIFCETVYEKETINIGEKIGLSVIEVKDIEEAMKYLLI